MLGKLIRYEWKAAARVCLPIYLAAIVLGVLNGAFMSYDHFTTPQVIMMVLYVMVCCAVVVVTTVVLIQRFYKNLLGDEGYLMFTLPTTVGQNILAKGIVATLLTLLACVAGMLSALMLAMPADGTNSWDLFMDFFKNLGRAFREYPDFIGFSIEGIILIIVGTAASILFIYLCIAIGQLWSRHRIMGAVAAYFALTTAAQIISSFIFWTVSEGAWNWISQIVKVESALIHVGILFSIAVTAAVGAGLFFATRRLLSHHLNLE